MDPDRENAPSAGNPLDDRKQTLVAMRGGWEGWRVWSEEEQARIDINECTDARCMNVDANCGFQGLAEGSVLSQAAGVGDELRAAWKTMLQDEGKFNSGGKSLRETIFGSAEPK